MISINEKDLKEIKKIIKKYLPNSKLIIFGSRHKGTNIESSDIDIAIDNKEKIKYRILANIKYDLQESNIILRVDIVDYNNIDDDFKNIINESNEVINI